MVKVLRLKGLVGLPGKFNDVVYCSPIPSGGLFSSSSDNAASVPSCTNSSSMIVFFPGDIQDYPESMEERDEARAWQQWNLEYTARLLATMFTGFHIALIRASRMADGIFNCYDNFMPTNREGVPKHSSNFGATVHLKLLLNEAQKAIDQDHQKCSSLKKDSASSKGELSESKWDKGEMKLIGFSKGCTVLNQLVYEMANKDQGTSLKDLNVNEIVWLDGGHSGDSETWVTADSPLNSLASSGIKLQVHLTPFQLHKQITSRDEAQFSDALKNLGADLTRQIHFKDEQPSLLRHFQLLETFKKAASLK